MQKQLIPVICILIIVMFSGCIGQENQESEAKGQIIDENYTTNFDYYNYTTFANITVKNIGENGDLDVWVYLRQGIHYDEEKTQTVYFNSGETKIVPFVFSEGFSMVGSFEHSCGIR